MTNSSFRSFAHIRAFLFPQLLRRFHFSRQISDLTLAMASAKESGKECGADIKSSPVTNLKPKAKPKKVNVADTIVNALFKLPETICGRELNTAHVYIEIGRRQPLWLATSGGGKEEQDQITIRAIQVQPKFRRQGIFKALVKRILELTGGVQLEAIENKWLVAAVDKSPLWKPQSSFPEDKGQIGTTYSRVGKPDPNTHFSCFSPFLLF